MSTHERPLANCVKGSRAMMMMIRRAAYLSEVYSPSSAQKVQIVANEKYNELECLEAINHLYMNRFYHQTGPLRKRFVNGVYD